MKLSCFERIVDYLNHNTSINDDYFDKREYCGLDESCSNDCRIDNLMDLLSLMADSLEDTSETLLKEPESTVFPTNFIKAA